MPFDASATEPFAKRVFDAAQRGAYDEIDKVIGPEFASQEFYTQDKEYHTYFEVLKAWGKCLRKTNAGSAPDFQKYGLMAFCLREVCAGKDMSSSGMNWAFTNLQKCINNFGEKAFPEEEHPP